MIRPKRSVKLLFNVARVTWRIARASAKPCTAVALMSPVALAAGAPPAEKFVQPLGIRLLHDGINQVVQSFGPAPVRHLQKLRERHVCYLWPNALVSYEIGDEGIGASFEMSQLPALAPAECAAVKSSAAATRLAVGGLHLGMPEAEFVTLVGNKSYVKDGWRVAEYSWVEKLPDAKGRLVIDAQVEVDVEGKFLDGRLVDLRISKTEAT